MMKSAAFRESRSVWKIAAKVEKPKKEAVDHIEMPGSHMRTLTKSFSAVGRVRGGIPFSATAVLGPSHSNLRTINSLEKERRRARHIAEERGRKRDEDYISAHNHIFFIATDLQFLLVLRKSG